MWRFRFGDPRTSAPTGTVQATAAQVTTAGLTIDLDQWGGSKSATWKGLTGPAQDNARVWIDVQTPGGWQEVFGGVLVRRPSGTSGEREALGDREYRLNWLPVERLTSAPTDQERATALQPGGDLDLLSLDIGQAARMLGAEAKLTLPHLVVSKADVPDAGKALRREYRGESMTAALTGLLAAKVGWGWTVLPGDRLHIGPPAERVATLNDATPGVQVTYRDVVTEGTQNVVRWVWTLPDGQQIVHKSRHAHADQVGSYGVTRYVDGRSTAAVVENAPAVIYEKSSSGSESDVTATYDFLRGAPEPGTAVGLILGLRVVCQEAADWVEVEFYTFPGGNPSLEVVTPQGSVTRPYSTENASGETFRVFVTGLPAGSSVGLTHPDISSAGKTSVAELNPHRLNRTLLDDAATDLYRIPPQHAASASEPGLQPPAGSVVITRPGRSDITEKIVGTRYLIREPVRTEYLIGEPDNDPDATVLRVLVDRKDQAAVDQAVNTRGTP